MDCFVIHWRFLTAVLSCCLLISGGSAENDSKPNILLIMADDLGIGDLGCYGNDTIRTPNIDRLAKEGVKLTQHISAAAFCTPSRTAFMTSRYPIRSGMASESSVPVILWNAASGGLPNNETTFAKILQKQGYTTGLIGKWHLGVNCENRTDHCHHPLYHGFDYFYGLPYTLVSDCRPGLPSEIMPKLQDELLFLNQVIGLGLLSLILGRLAGLLPVGWKVIGLLSFCGTLCFLSWYIPFGLFRQWNCIIMKNNDVIEQPFEIEEASNDLLQEAINFIERNKERPFLLYFSFMHVHTPLSEDKRFAGKSKYGQYGDTVEEMDWIIGEITDSIKRLSLENKTLVYFTSDHGGHLESRQMGKQTGGWNGVYKGGKGMAGWEGGIRVPGIFKWPGVFQAETTINEPTSLMDIYPTVVSLAGGTLPEDRTIDGRNLMPLLLGRTHRSEHEFMFHYCGSYLHAVRWHPKNSDAVYKAHYVTPIFSPEGAVGCYNTRYCMCYGPGVMHHDPPLLFDISVDPSEMHVLSPQTEPKYYNIIKQLQAAVEEHNNTLTDVPKQMSFYNVIWKPWLQPCCGTFPFCSCSKNSEMHSADDPN
ncbi:arylsulfatase H-like isoform X2 [Protopterus annectens]|nr:arylsulfatase H-like isoform X2 [Protopterus annectens]XP_043928383.1 arylsulfatase H-like isoform X2 [Protopterus annectens]